MDFEEELRQMEFKSMEEFHRPNSKNVVWKLAGDDLKAILAAHNQAVREARVDELKAVHSHYFDGNLVEAAMKMDSWVLHRLKELEQDK